MQQLPLLPDLPWRYRFASIPAHSVRADFAGGGLSSDLGPVLLRGVDLQIGLTKRLAAALPDRRHQSYVSHSYHDLLTQRIYQIGCGYEDGNDANSLRHDPMFKLGAARLPFDDDAALASGATISRFEHGVPGATERKPGLSPAVAVVSHFKPTVRRRRARANCRWNPRFDRPLSLRVVRCRSPPQTRTDARKFLRPALGKPRRRKPRGVLLASAGATGYGDLNGAGTQAGVNCGDRSGLDDVQDAFNDREMAVLAMIGCLQSNDPDAEGKASPHRP